MSLIIDTVKTFLPPKRKSTPSGWISFNAVCCHNNNNTMDTRQRGGIMINEGVSYHCFNCGFKTSWQPGRIITSKFRKLMRWLNVPDDLITKCSLEALRQKENSSYQSKINLLPSFIDKILPPDTVRIASDNHDEILAVVSYLANRGFSTEDFDWYWSPVFANRVIVPFYYENRVVGYTARLLRDGKPKYISEQQPGYVFNIDNQHKDNRKFVIVCEGPFDAISIDGVAILGSEISDSQKNLLNQLQKEIIVLPDKDVSGKKLLTQAIENNWSVSFPNWDDDVKDANDALIKYGKLATLYSILQAKQSSRLKIELYSKKWFI